MYFGITSSSCLRNPFRDRWSLRSMAYDRCLESPAGISWSHQWEISRILKWRYVSTRFLAIFWRIFPYIGLKNRPYIWYVPPINRFLSHGHWSHVVCCADLVGIPIFRTQLCIRVPWSRSSYHLYHLCTTSRGNLPDLVKHEDLHVSFGHFLQFFQPTGYVAALTGSFFSSLTGADSVWIWT